LSGFVRLSHDIRAGDPGWPGNFTYEYEQVSSTEQGDVANFGILHLLNHFGTHLDAPNHFNPDGLKIAQVPIDRFVFERPLVVDVEKSDRELVSRSELEAHSSSLEQADLLVLRSGWSAVRADDPERYANDGPGVSTAACEYLIDEFPGVKAVAMDWISLATPKRLDEGVPAHQVLCGVGRGDRYVIIIEDVDLSRLPRDVKRIYAIPLFPQLADSSPCTVFAEV
jgi:kynurenine formamidase